MTTPFLSEIRMLAFNFPPQNWALANGQLLPINQNQALFSLLGTTYGGNGQTTFGLPDLRSRTPMHWDQNSFNLGQAGGQTTHTLTTAEMPAHTHTARAASANADAALSTGHVLAAALNLYTTPTATTPLVSGTIQPAGGGQPHENMSPYLTINFCIALTGVFPSRN